MLDDTETLDSVFSFLAQIDLPTGLTTLDEEAVDSHEMLPVLSVGISREDEAKLNALCRDDVDVEAPVLDQSVNSSSPASSVASSPQPSETSTDKVKLKRVRISKKQQIDTLREEVQELNKELQSLLPGPNADLHPHRESMWREIADRQLKRREQAEEENSKLRDMVQIQIHEARNLRRVLKRRTKIEMMEEMLGMKRQKRLEYNTPDDNPQVFENMLRDTDELYVGMDALFDQKGIYDLPIPSRRSEPRHNVTSGLFLESINRHRVPFDLRTTEKAMWKVMGQNMFQGLQNIQDLTARAQFHDHHVEESNNTIKTSFFVDIAGFGDVRGAQFRKVVKKYVENDRVVLICKNLMEPVMQAKGTSAGFQTRTTLRVEIRSDSSQSSKTSVIDSHFTATRFNNGGPGSYIIHSSANMATGVAAWDEAISQIAHRVESLAIDESCTKRSL
ncbi:hypothetical protein P3T76_010493 [Phytophthora citrophthora]|uniref:M96 mating-specific protein family n=1 Tax=Phytophthora citrophthora TaxID=4793 RepID=A0AAD9LHM4_9STRA|nr:hypothetical protein P3T76_010493 [Phytophthora citrophthora]